MSPGTFLLLLLGQEPILYKEILSIPSGSPTSMLSYYISFCVYPKHGRPQTFFQGRAKIFQGGARTYFLPKKTTKKILFTPKKSKNILFLAHDPIEKI
jgi:hypothetical protein